MQGDERSCKNLYETYLPYCYGICIRYGIYKDDIKDHIQIIFSSTFESLHKFDESKASFKTWFSRICVYKILEIKRNNNRRLAFDSLSESHYELESKSTIEADIDKAYMFRIINKMPSQYLDVFNMFIIDGYSHKEIAKALQITEGSSRVLLKRGRDWAKKSLSNHLLTN